MMILVIFSVFPVGVDFHSFFFYVVMSSVQSIPCFSCKGISKRCFFWGTLGDIHVLLLKHDGMLRIKTAVD